MSEPAFVIESSSARSFMNEAQKLISFMFIAINAVIGVMRAAISKMLDNV